jgi:hypothetical protein
MTALLMLWALCAPPVDWANHDFGMFTLKGGQAEMREYVEAGGLHDTHLWRLLETHPLRIAERDLTLVMIQRTDHLAHGASARLIRIFLFDGPTEVASQTVRAPSARFKIQNDRLIVRWIEGIDRVRRSWRITPKGFADRQDGRLRPRRLGH